MATRIKTDSGITIVLRNPSEKAKRYARQMKSGVVRETGELLTKTDMAYRAGYLDARNDNAKLFNKEHGRKGKGRSAVNKTKKK